MEVEIGRSGSIDALKGLAILSVILLHAFPREWLVSSLAWFHIWQAVPIFMVLLGVTGYRTRVAPLGSYYLRRARRLLPALAITWIVALVAAYFWGTASWDLWVVAGRLPSSRAPGNYFITIMVEFVLILPLLRALWRRSHWAGLLVCFLASLAFELAAFSFGISGYAYSSSILRYLFAVALGFWIAEGRSVLPLLPASLAYLVACSLGFRVPFFIGTWRPQDVFAFIWSASIVQVGLGVLTRAPQILVRLGQASYHIFLIQMLWFAFGVPLVSRQPAAPAVVAVISVVVCCGIGLAFQALDSAVFQPTADGRPNPA